jgi:hypothetical protein
MTSKMIALRIVDGLFIATSTAILLGIAGLPMEWLLPLVDMSLRQFEWFALVIVLVALWLIHAIATSDTTS